MRIVRYFFVGGAAAIVDVGLFFLFAKLAGFPYLLVGAASFLVATLVNYLLSVRHVFQSGARFDRRNEVLLVYLVSMVGLAINQAVLWFAVETLGAELMLSKLLATATVFFWNYWGRAHFVFRVRPDHLSADTERR